MALYNFHRVLIVATILFDFFLSLYAYRTYDDTGERTYFYLMIFSTVASLGLIAYLVHFNRMVRTLRQREQVS